MLSYALRRCLGAVPTLLILVTLSFFMMRVAPGGPFDSHRRATPEVLANLERAYHLDEPLPQQYLRYLGNLARLDLGPSFKYRDYGVGELIAQGFPVSLALGFWASVVSLLLGVTLGTAAALRRNRPLDHGAMGLATMGVVVPSFVVAPVCQLLFGVLWALLPVGGWDGSARSMVLPVAALALPNIGYVAQLTRGSMIEALRSNHVRTARAKGMGPRITLLRHAMRGGLLPVLAYLGPATAGIVTGSVVVEKIFGIPGIGRYFVDAASNRDYTLVMGVVLFYGTLIILFNLLVDLALGLLDPTIRHD
ncbi:MAG: oligopeptide ABC transporter permease OppB [Dongiaceae bacterium]